MKPRNKYQKRIVELSHELAPLTIEHRTFAEQKTVAKYALVSRNRFYCTECNHKWEPTTDVKKTTCPCCSSKLTLVYDTKTTDHKFTAILQTKAEFQIVRILMSKTYYAVKELPKMRSTQHSEIVQYWIDTDGKVTIMGVDTYMMAGAYRQYPFNVNTEMSIKDSERYYIYPEKIFPKRKVTKQLHKYGFKGSTHGFSPHYVMSKILQSNKLETLWKLGYYDLFEQLAPSDRRQGYYGYSIMGYQPKLDEYWSAFKIVLRHNYKLSNASDYIDYLDMLSEFGKDLSSPKFVCPTDLDYEHNKYVQKRNRKRRRAEKAKQREEIKKNSAEFYEMKSKYFGLLFKDKDLTIEPLKSIKAFDDEGYELIHCVFNKSYYLNPNKLIMSARINGVRIETVDINLNSMTINQSRGLKNKSTMHHQRIINLVEKNFDKIVAIRDKNMAKAS